MNEMLRSLLRDSSSPDGGSKRALCHLGKIINLRVNFTWQLKRHVINALKEMRKSVTIAAAVQLIVII